MVLYTIEIIFALNLVLPCCSKYSQVHILYLESKFSVVICEWQRALGDSTYKGGLNSHLSTCLELEARGPLH